METLKNLAHDLDYELGGIGCKVITLNDIRTLIGHLREDMDNLNEKDLRIHFREIHRTVRVLDELCRYTVDELNDFYETTKDIKQAIFDEVVGTRKIDGVDIGPHEESSSVYPLREVKWMSPEKDREVAMKHNTLSFISEFDRVPKDEQEVLGWVAEIAANLKGNQQKKSSSHGNDEEDNG